MTALAIIAPTLPAAISDQLQAWAVEARAAMSENTQRAYAVDSRAFADWCAEQGLSTLPASPSQVAEFLRSESEAGKAVATVRRRAATIARMHKAAGLPNPCSQELVLLALKGIARTRGTDQRQAAALTERDAVTIRAHMGESLRDVRDLALLLVGRDLLARSSDLVELEAAGVEWTDEGATVRMRRRKTSTDTHTHFIGSEAAQALRSWLQRAEIAAGAIFRSITKGGRVTDKALGTRDVRRILKARAVSARLVHAGTVSGHSLRVGMAQDLVAADLDIASVMQAGGWATPRMVARYTENLTARRGAIARYYGGRR
jgi:site-specific recombinase XerD